MCALASPLGLQADHIDNVTISLSDALGSGILRDMSIQAVDCRIDLACEFTGVVLKLVTR